ncbi:MAG TPA: biotin/lipoyl-containing protein, partial [Thermomicrobiales bacterium]|nr:biotin/lipoyl-containing protein [Thermomicrobiales bacterium]
MAEVIMPKMGDAMEEGTLLKWLKAVGDEVAEGDALAEIETDKVTLELEAQEDGFLTNTLVEEGAVVPIGESVAIIGTQDEVGQSAPAPAAAPEEMQEASAEAEQAPASPAADGATEAAAGQPAEKRGESAQQVDGRKPGERVRASPLVKRLAQEHGIDLSQVAGTGPGGRIINADIQPYVSGEKSAPQAAVPDAPMEAAAPSPSPAPLAAEGKGVKVDMPKIKRTTGKRMSESKLGIPHYYVTSNVDMEAALAFRKQVNVSLGEDGGRVSVND